MARSSRILGLIACLAIAIAAGSIMLRRWEADQMPVMAAADWQAHKLGPKSSLSVFWVGHSLVEHKADSGWGQVSLMSVVGKLADSRKLGYEMTDHTLFGSPLSALWRGRPYSYDRDATEMIAKRERFEREASRYDALVLTEAIPLEGTVKYEFSSYYLRLFSCTLLNANPAARVYLYQTWVHFQGSDRGEAGRVPSTFDWRKAMKTDRALWDKLADTARLPNVRAPGWLGWFWKSDAGCTTQAPIFSIPVGNAMVALDERLESPHSGDDFKWPGGTAFRMTDLFANPLVATADNSGAAQKGGPEAASFPKIRDPSKPLDDIHPSLAGIYFAALVHFATLYRQTPVGLPYPPEIGAPLARTFQCVAWDTVLSDERSGVSGHSDC